MEKHVQEYVDRFMAEIIAKNPGEKEFHQAVHEVVESLAPYILENPVLAKMKVLERIAEPERVVMFRVPWLNDKGEIEINRGYRVQMNSAIGPYKGGLRFPCFGEPEYSQVSGLRTDLQKQPDHPCRWGAEKAVRTSAPKANPTMKSCASANRS